MYFSEYQFKDTKYLDKAYDDNIKLLYLKRNPNNDLLFNFNAEYAYQLLASIEYADRLLTHSENIARAEDILSVCESLQYNDSNKESFALFPYHYNLPKECIKTTIEHNTVSFKIGIQFLHILKKHKFSLNKNLVKKIEISVYNLLFRLSTFDKIYHGGTFMHFVQTYLLILGSDYFSNPDFFHCGIINFDNLYSNVTYHENFFEYNSFYEFFIISEILSSMKNILIDNALLNKVDTLYDLLWFNISRNFHSDFCILTGPQSSISRHVPQPYFLYFLSVATGIEFDSGKLPYAYDVISRCPEKYLQKFQSMPIESFMISTISKGINSFRFHPARIASCYIHPDYAIGSINRQTFFFEHIPLVGFFRSKKEKSPYRFTIEVLANNHPLSLALLHSVQYKNTILGAITFTTDYGEIHPHVTQKHGIISSNSFKIRFKIAGDISELDIKNYDRELIIRYDNIFLRYKVPYIQMDSLDVNFKLTYDENNLYYDAIITKREISELDFSKLKEAISQFLITIQNDSDSFPECKCYTSENNLSAELISDEYTMKTVTPYTPDTTPYTSTNDIQTINNLMLHQYVEYTNSKAKQYKFIAESISEINLPNLETDTSFTQELTKLKNTPINMLPEKVRHLLGILVRKNISTDVFKRYSIHIIKTTFERVKNENIQFEQMLSRNYYDIYNQISYLSKKQPIADLIQNITNEIKNFSIEIRHQPTNQMLVSNVKKILDNDYSNPTLSLATLSDITGFSEQYISKQFKSVVGINYVKYLSKIRIEKAKILLSDNMPAQEVSEKCGYLNLHTFKRVFKEYTGVTVTEWLKKRQSYNLNA